MCWPVFTYVYIISVVVYTYSRLGGKGERRKSMRYHIK